MRIRPLLPLIALCGLYGSPGEVLSQPAYTIEALDLLPGDDEAQVNAVNATGTVVGGTRLTGDAYDSAAWTSGTTSATNLAGVIGQASSVATAVNGSGQFAVQAIAPGNILYSAQVWNGATLTDIGSIGGAIPSGGLLSIAKGMNDSGQVVGYAWSPSGYRGFSWQNGMLTELAGPAGCNLWEAWGVNSSGQIVGRAALGTCGFNGQGVVWPNASAPAVLLTDVLAAAGIPPRPVGIRFAFSINDGGTVLAQETLSGRLRCLLITPSPAAVVELGVLGPNPASAGCIPGTVNNLGEAVAYMHDNGVDDIAVLWSGGTLYDLQTLLDAPSQAAWDLETAVAINDSGTITGLGTFNGKLVGYRATRTGGPGGGITVTDSVGTPDDRQLAFGNITIGAGALGTVTVNNGTDSAANISITDNLQAPFGIADPGDCTIDLAPATSCTITVTYNPVTVGAFTDSLTLSLGGTPTVVNVSGTGRTGTTALTDSLPPATDGRLPFDGNVPVGGSGTASVTIQNTDGVPVTVRRTGGLATPFAFQNAAACDVILNPGQSCTLTVIFSPTAAGAVNSSFTVDAGGTVYTVAVSGAPGVPNADIGVSQTITPLVVQPGVSGSDLATITITVRNGGPDAAAATVTDILPAGLTFVSAAPGQGTYTQGTGLWDVGSLANGATATLQILAQAAPEASGCVTNTAQLVVPAPAVDSSAGNNTASVFLAAPACANVRIGLQSIDDFVDTRVDGDGIEVKHYSEVRNDGPSAASGVVLTVEEYTDFRRLGNGVFELGTLEAGETRTVLISNYLVSDTGDDLQMEYSLSLASTTPDPVLSDNRYSGGYPIVRNPSGDGSSCFIATAAFGSFLEPEVVALRAFRDRWLLTHAPGRAFVAWYYRVSPPLADAIRANDALRLIARGALTPVVLVAKYPLASLVLMLLGTALWFVRRQQRI